MTLIFLISLARDSTGLSANGLRVTHSWRYMFGFLAMRCDGTLMNLTSMRTGHWSLVISPDFKGEGHRDKSLRWRFWLLCASRRSTQYDLQNGEISCINLSRISVGRNRRRDDGLQPRQVAWDSGGVPGARPKTKTGPPANRGSLRPRRWRGSGTSEGNRANEDHFRHRFVVVAAGRTAQFRLALLSGRRVDTDRR